MSFSRKEYRRNCKAGPRESPRKLSMNISEESINIHAANKLLIDHIKKYFVTYLQRYVETPDHLISIRWFYTQKLIDFMNIDPLLPYNTDDNEGLYYELEKVKCSY